MFGRTWMAAVCVERLRKSESPPERDGETSDLWGREDGPDGPDGGSTAGLKCWFPVKRSDYNMKKMPYSTATLTDLSPQPP